MNFSSSAECPPPVWSPFSPIARDIQSEVRSIAHTNGPDTR